MNRNLLIFDLDGTLFDTSKVIVPAVLAAMEELGFSAPQPEQIQKAIGLRIEQFVDSILPQVNFETREAFIKVLRKYEREFIAKKGQLYPGVQELLSQLLAQDYQLAICSNGSIAYIRLVLKSMDIEEFFSHLLGRDSGRSKQEIIADLLTTTQPSFAAVIGDRIDDLKAAQENQLPFIGAGYGFGRTELEDTLLLTSEPIEIAKKIAQAQVYGKIATKLQDYTDQQNPLIGINGVDTSGKSSFAKNLQQFLCFIGKNTRVIHLDDFHHPSQIRSSGSNPIQSYIDHAFNLEQLEKELLAPLKRGEVIDKELTLLDLETDAYTLKKQFNIKPGDLILLEGVLLFRPPIDSYIDCRIFLDITFDEVLRRAESRDVPRFGPGFLQRYRDKYIPIQKQYIKQWQPKERADIAINNNDYKRPKIIK